MARHEADGDAPVRLSIVIPAYNEERRLPNTLDDVLEYLRGQPYRSEVIVADDGSTDRTADVVRAQQLRATNLRLVQHPDRRNYGKGAAVRRGMLAATGQFRLFMDADNSTTIDHVERFWPFFDEGYDIVIGSRAVEGAVVAVHQAWFKELAGDFGNFVIQSLAVPGIHDTQAGFKVFTQRVVTDVFPRLTIDRWGFDIEILAVARRRGYRAKEAPITWINDPHSKVKFSSYFEVLGEVWRIRRNLRAGLYD